MCKLWKIVSTDKRDQTRTAPTLWLIPHRKVNAATILTNDECADSGHTNGYDRKSDAVLKGEDSLSAVGMSSRKMREAVVAYIRMPVFSSAAPRCSHLPLLSAIETAQHFTTETPHNHTRPGQNRSIDNVYTKTLATEASR
jgi:hypothetical protein